MFNMISLKNLNLLTYFNKNEERIIQKLYPLSLLNPIILTFSRVITASIGCIVKRKSNLVLYKKTAIFFLSTMDASIKP